MSPLEVAQEDVADLEELHDGLDSGRLGYEYWDPDLTCKERQAIAVAESADALRTAREWLRKLEAAA